MTTFRPSRPRSDREKPYAAFALVLAVGCLFGLGTPAAASTDSCRFFANADFRGDQEVFHLPWSPPSGLAWSGTSVRRTGDQLDREGAIYRQAEGIRIEARRSDMVLYLFDGDNFDGKFQAFRCNQGSRPCIRRLTTNWRNRTRSFICQSDDFVSLDGLDSLQEELQRNHLIPTALMAAPLTAQIHDAVRAPTGGPIRIRSTRLKYGRFVWTTRHELCRRIDCQSTSWRDRYRDYLRYDYRVDVQLTGGTVWYRIYLKVWFQPVLRSGRLELLERGWTVEVTGGSQGVRNFIHNVVRGRVLDAYPGLGARLTTGLRNEVQRAIGSAAMRALFEGNRRLLFSHPCSFQLQHMIDSGETYTSAMIEDICGGATPHHAAAPGLRLLKD